MSVYPRNLSTFLNRLSGYNKNNVKMNVSKVATSRRVYKPLTYFFNIVFRCL